MRWTGTTNMPSSTQQAMSSFSESYRWLSQLMLVGSKPLVQQPSSNLLYKCPCVYTTIHTQMHTDACWQQSERPRSHILFPVGPKCPCTCTRLGFVCVILAVSGQQHCNNTPIKTKTSRREFTSLSHVMTFTEVSDPQSLSILVMGTELFAEGSGSGKVFRSLRSWV